jgi:hypothetical protein
MRNWVSSHREQMNSRISNKEQTNVEVLFCLTILMDFKGRCLCNGLFYSSESGRDDGAGADFTWRKHVTQMKENW